MKASAASSAPALPASAAGAWTGFAGAVAVGGCLLALRGVAILDHERTVLAILAATLTMVAVDAARLPRAVHHASPPPSRLATKLVGIVATWAAVAGAAWVFPEYGGDFYDPCRDALALVAPFLVVGMPLYAWWTDRRFGEDDVYARLGAWLLRLGPRPAPGELGAHARATLVKCFFFPLMFVYATRALAAAAGALESPAPASFLDAYRLVYDTVFMLDLVLTSAGYAFALRLLGTQVRTTEPTVFGWVVCIVCYQPFWSLIGGQYLAYDADGRFWDQVFAPWPAIQVAWGVAILGCISVYVWASMAFGLHFSNLSNRGVITAGPYRWMKHPAYVSKNLAWWLIAMPMVAPSCPEAVRACAQLGLLNGLYALRAWTEERHLRADPDYLAYEAWIATNGLWARVRRVVRG